MAGKNKAEKHTKNTHCPYCDREAQEELAPICSACSVTIDYCGACNAALPKGAKKCPACGIKVEVKK
jgi:hypothetical protein